MASETAGLALANVLYEKKGSRDLARREYSAALDLEPDRPDARAALKNLS